MLANKGTSIFCAEASAETREVVGIGGGIWRSLTWRGLGCPQILPSPKGFGDYALGQQIAAHYALICHHGLQEVQSKEKYLIRRIHPQRRRGNTKEKTHGRSNSRSCWSGQDPNWKIFK